VAELLVIANGRIEGQRRWIRAEKRLREVYGNGVEIRLTRGPGEATRMARELLQEGVSWIAVAGGDGTINEAVNGFFEDGCNIRPESHLSFLPCGTANDWARTAGVPQHPADAVDALAGAKVRAVDVGIAGFPGQKREQVFLNFAETGAGSEVMRRLERTGGAGATRAGYIQAAVRVACTYVPRRVTLSLDGGGETATGPLLSLVVASGRYFGSGIRVAPMAEPDDGVLDVITIGDFTRAEVMRKIGKFVRGEYLGESKVRHHRARSLEVSADTPLPVVLDGELAGTLPLRVRVAPRALRLRC